jgi:hypothetical protein
MQGAGLSDAEQEAIAAANCRRLLGLDRSGANREIVAT